MAIDDAPPSPDRLLEALAQSEERYRRLTEAVSDYVFTVRVENGVAVETVHGPGSVAVTGYTPEELDLDPDLWIEIVVPEDRPVVLDAARRILNGSPARWIEARIIRKDGQVRWVRNTLVPRFDAGGSIIGCDGLLKDITERRELEAQLLQAQKMESIGRLAGGVAHDFNNLLTAIIGYVELARMDLPADLPADHPALLDLDEITTAGQRAASITRQLLAFACKQLLTPIRLDLNELVTDSLKMLGRLLPENIEIVTCLGEQLGLVEADPGQVQQILVNLTVNARDAMPHGGTLTIETSRQTIEPDYAAAHPDFTPGCFICLSVTDTGTGMTEEVRDRLFEPFFTTKEPGKGTGLGLATCHGVAKQMAGFITVQSQLGQGSTFRVYLPALDGELEPSVAERPLPIPTGNETVLVVEDEPSVRRMTVLALSALGYSVLEAASGADALSIARRRGPQIDLVISDLIMPGMGGLELAGQVRAVAADSRFLLVSGHAQPQDEADGIDRGYEFLAKPFTPDQLGRTVRRILDSR